MTRRLRIQRPPFVRESDLQFWINQVTDVMNQFPPFSLESTSDGPESVVSASPGTILIDVGSSNTTFWAKLSGESSSGWTAFVFV